MTYYQEHLLERAKQEWELGRPIDIGLYSVMASEGMDVPRLEIIYKQDELEGE